jgi:hypothetical protein
MMTDTTTTRAKTPAMNPSPDSPHERMEVTGLADHLAAMTKMVFQSGMGAAVVKAKWEGLTAAFHSFDCETVAALSLDDVDRLLTESAIRAPAVRIAQDGQVLAPTRFTRAATLAGEPLTGLVDARKVLALFDGGA